MAKKIKLVTVKNKDGKEIGINSTVMPRKNEPGIYWVPKLNILGANFIQQKHPEITGSKEMEEHLAKMFGIPKEGFGTLGKMEDYDVFVDGNLAQTAVETVMEPEMEAPPGVPAPQPAEIKETVTMPTPAPAVEAAPAVADTTKQVADPEKDDINVKAIMSAIKQGYTRDVIVAELAKVQGEEHAIKLYHVAENIKAKEEQLTPVVPAAPALGFN